MTPEQLPPLPEPREIEGRWGYDSDDMHAFYVDGFNAATAALRAELDALRGDAERYRWLRSRIPGGTYRIMGVVYSEGGAGVDAAIDAAMKGTP